MMRSPPGVPPLQWKTANTCPFKCMPSVVQTLAPAPGSGVSNIISRCQICLARWDTDRTGKILKVVQIAQAEVCPDCTRPFLGQFDLPEDPKNLCKNPDHVASKLVQG